MTIQPATADTKFEPVSNWGALPMGITFRGDATSVAVDSKDNVYVFNRGNNPIAVFDADGNFLRGMAHGEVTRPHGIEFDKDDNLYLVDDDAAGNCIEVVEPDKRASVDQANAVVTGAVVDDVRAGFAAGDSPTGPLLAARRRRRDRVTGVSRLL